MTGRCDSNNKRATRWKPHDHAPLIAYETLGRDAQLAVPTPEHYLPLLYVLGLRRADEPISFPITGIEGGSISMLTVQIGLSAPG